MWGMRVWNDWLVPVSALALLCLSASLAQAAISVTLSDPQNDTFGAGTYDIKELSVFADDGNGNPGNSHLRIQVRFYGNAIALPSSNDPDALFGFILIDLDGDVDMDDFLEQFLLNPDPSTLIGGPVEYYVDIGSEGDLLGPGPGKVDVVSTASNSAVATPNIIAAPSFFDVFVELSIARSDLGMSPNNQVNVHVGAIMGTSSEPTDVVPNVPEPGSGVLAGALLFLAGGLLGRRGWPAAQGCA